MQRFVADAAESEFWSGIGFGASAEPKVCQEAAKPCLCKVAQVLALHAGPLRHAF